MSTKVGFIEKMNVKIAPIANKIAKQRHLNAVSGGIMATIPLTILGSFLMILANPPVNETILANNNFFTNILQVWVDFAAKYYNILIAPFNMTMGVFSLIAAFTIAYQLSKSYKLPALSGAITSVVIFMLVAAPATMAVFSSLLASGADVTTLPSANMMNMKFLGSEGLFTAIIISIATVEINRLCYIKKWSIKMPESVPPMIAEPFTALIPLLLNLIVIYGINALLLINMGMGLPAAIMSVLTPSINAINNPFTVILLAVFAMTLWVFGIHGTSVVSPLIMPLVVQASFTNAALVEAGQVAIFDPIFLWGFISIGGAGCTLGLVFLMSRSKSKQLSTIGKIGIIPGLCGINEPIIFGAPIIYNPLLAIPFIISPVVCMLLGWLGYSVGFLTLPFIPVLSLLPIGISQFMGSLSIVNALFPIFLIFVSGAIYYPFFKVYERQLIQSENEAATESK